MSLQNMKESVNLTGESIIEDTVVVAFSAHIPSNGIAGSVTISIRDIEKYNVDREQVRQDQLEFQNAVWAKEDEMSN